MPIQTSEIQLNVNDKKVSAYLANGGGAGILLLHAWWGLKPFFKQTCDQLAEQGFTVLAPDLRDGQIASTTGLVLGVYVPILRRTRDVSGPAEV